MHTICSIHIICLFVTLQSVSQTVRLVPESLPGVKVEITPMCEKCVHRVIVYSSIKYW